MKKPFITVALSIVLLTSAVIAKTIVSGKVSTYGNSLGKMEKETDDLKTQNMVIREELLSLTSLNHVASAAAELGFAESKTQLVFSKSLPLALKR